MPQETLALIPGADLEGIVGKEGVERREDPSQPEDLLLLAHLLAQDRLHEAMKREGVDLWLTLHDRPASQGANHLVEPTGIGSQRFKERSQMRGTCYEYLFGDR